MNRVKTGWGEFASHMCPVSCEQIQADDGSLWQAFVASVRHLAAEKHLDTSVLHGDGTNTVAKKGAMGLATRATNISRGRKSSPSSTIMAPS